MSRDRFDVLERFAPLFEAPEPSFEEFLRRRERKLRNKRIAAGVVAIAVFAAPIALFAGLIYSDRNETRPGESTDARPGRAVIDQAFADSINECERLLVTKQQVGSALGFRPGDPAPFRLPGGIDAENRVERYGGVADGCGYPLFDGEHSFGPLVISAYTADDPPAPVGQSTPVQGIGDEAGFTRIGNRDGHVIGPEGATSMLQVRSGGLILRINGGVDSDLNASPIGARLSALQQLARDALATLPAIVPTVPPAPEADYVIDLNTGVTTPLPKPILRSVDDSHRMLGRYAASPDGSRLAFVGPGDEGSNQIFIADIDGTGVRQMTHDPIGASFPAWSPDGTRIAFEGYGSGDVLSIFVLDVATGESTQVTDEPPQCRGCFRQPVFTPDGSSLIYTGGTASDEGVLRTVPVTGGKSALLFDPQAQGLGHAGSGSLSPDGSLLTFRGHEIGGPGALRFLANPDGSDWRIMPNCYDSNPAGTWSPDGTRIVCMGGGTVKVADIATGEASPVAEGSGAIWLDDHTLLVEA
jgi:Tol biopolymer transport system component